MAKVREEIPNILKRVDRLQSQIDAIRNSFPDTAGSTISPIVQRIDKLQRQVDKLYAELPIVLDVVKQASLTLQQINAQVDKIRPLIPEAINELAMLRQAIPVYLMRAEKMISDSKDISEEAGRGLFKNVISGIISAPFELLSAPRKLFDDDFKNKRLYADEDMRMLLEATQWVLSRDELTEKGWRNPKTKNEGKVRSIKHYIYSESRCVKLEYSLKASTGEEDLLYEDACLNADAQWEKVD